MSCPEVTVGPRARVEEDESLFVPDASTFAMEAEPGPSAPEDGLDVVAVRIEHERRVVLIRGGSSAHSSARSPSGPLSVPPPASKAAA